MTSVQSVVDFAATHSPVFVVGMERGGTSIVYQTLATAPVFASLRGDQETFIFDDPAAVMAPGVRSMTAEYIGGAENLKEFRAWYEGLSGWPDSWMPPRRIVSAYFYFVCEKGLAQRIIEKTPRHAFKIDFIKRCFPKSRIIGTHRHPFGVVESYRSRLAREIALGAPPESYAWLNRTPKQICAHIDKISAALRQGLEKYPGSMIVISYEELLRDPAFVFSVLTDFCQLEGVTVKVSDGKSVKKSGSDPLLKADGVVTTNEFRSKLTVEEKKELLREFPQLFEFTSGIKTKPVSA